MDQYHGLSHCSDLQTKSVVVYCFYAVVDSLTFVEAYKLVQAMEIGCVEAEFHRM